MRSIQRTRGSLWRILTASCKMWTYTTPCGQAAWKSLVISFLTTLGKSKEQKAYWWQQGLSSCWERRHLRPEIQRAFVVGGSVESIPNRCGLQHYAHENHFMIMWNANTLALMRRARLTQQLRFSYFESVDSSFLKEANIKAVLKKRRGQLVLYFLCFFLFRLCRFRRKVFGMEIKIAR